jgi:hypothetical protein
LLPRPKWDDPKMLSTVAAVVRGELFLTKEKTAMKRRVVQKGFRNSRIRNSSGVDVIKLFSSSLD